MYPVIDHGRKATMSPSSDFDSPPPTPKYGRYSPPHATTKYVTRHFRRPRFVVLLGVAIVLFIYFVWRPHKPRHVPKHAPSLRYKNINWSRYAYSQYATDSHYLCNSLMVFATLHRLGSRADRILMYPEEWDTEIASKSDRDSQLLVMARDWYRVKLIPIKISRFQRDGDSEKGEGEQVSLSINHLD